MIESLFIRGSHTAVEHDVDDIVDALDEYGPLTGKELQLICHRSSSDVKRRLCWLRDEDVVDIYDHPDDGRKVQYDLDR